MTLNCSHIVLALIFCLYKTSNNNDQSNQSSIYFSTLQSKSALKSSSNAKLETDLRMKLNGAPHDAQTKAAVNILIFPIRRIRHWNALLTHFVTEDRHSTDDRHILEAFSSKTSCHFAICNAIEYIVQSNDVSKRFNVRLSRRVAIDFCMLILSDHAGLNLLNTLDFFEKSNFSWPWETWLTLITTDLARSFDSLTIELCLSTQAR